jgi:hypothetical protein
MILFYGYGRSWMHVDPSDEIMHPIVPERLVAVLIKCGNGLSEIAQKDLKAVLFLSS